MIEPILKKYNIAIQTKSNEIKLSTIEVGIIITELTRLYSSQVSSELLEELKSLNSKLDSITIEQDAGKFI